MLKMKGNKYFFFLKFTIKTCHDKNSIKRKLKLKIKSVAYSLKGSHTGQLDVCNRLAHDSTTGL